MKGKDPRKRSTRWREDRHELRRSLERLVPDTEHVNVPLASVVDLIALADELDLVRGHMDVIRASHASETDELAAIGALAEHTRDGDATPIGIVDRVTAARRRPDFRTFRAIDELLAAASGTRRPRASSTCCGTCCFVRSGATGGSWARIGGRCCSWFDRRSPASLRA